jgi:hypothetical protein
MPTASVVGLTVSSAWMSDGHRQRQSYDSDGQGRQRILAEGVKAIALAKHSCQLRSEKVRGAVPSDIGVP